MSWTDHGWHRLALDASLLLWALSPLAARGADFVAECPSCEARAGDETAQLLYRAAEDQPVTIRWSTREIPAEDGWEIRLYAGNPSAQDQIPDLGPLTFSKGGHWYKAEQRFEPEALGRGTFLTVLTRRKANGRGDEEILDWRAWRLLTTEEHAREVAGPAPMTRYELNVTPAALRADTARGPLPRGRGGDQAIWFSLVDAQDGLADVDLDGDVNGIAGLNVNVSAPWAAGTGATDPAQGLKDSLRGVEGSTVTLGELEWVEQDPQEVELEAEAEGARILLRHYYTVITLSTRASTRTFKGSELGRGLWNKDRVYLAHETSDTQRTTAALSKDPPHPRLWASWSRREMSADPHLLDLVHAQLKRGQPIPGLPAPVMIDGDGGSVGYHAGFVAGLSSWLEGDEGARYSQPGFVSLEIVAARVGHGSLTTSADGSDSRLRQLAAQMSGGDDRQPLSLGAPPDGFYTASVSAGLGSAVGALPMLETDGVAYGQRGDDAPVFLGGGGAGEAGVREAGAGLDALTRLANSGELTAEGADASRILAQAGFPTRARFVLSANLRAGALVEGQPGGKVYGMVPIDAYAQYVVKMTVAMLPTTKLVTTHEQVAADAAEAVSKDVTVDVDKAEKRNPGLLARLESKGLTWILVCVVIVGIIALFMAFPGLRDLVNAIFSRLAKAIGGGGDGGSDRQSDSKS